MPNVKTRTLTGGETEIRFGANYPHFWVQNFSDSDMYMSVAPNIVPDADGVMLIPAKSGRSTGDVGQTDTLYLSGSGKVEITAQYNAVCPYFKYAGKGGEIGGDLTDYAKKSELTSHTDDKNNPHEVTAKQLHFEPTVDMRGKTIGNLRTAILNWFKSAAGTLSAYRFSGDVDSSFYVNNWNNSSMTDSSTNRSLYTVKLLASAISPSGTEHSTAGTFLITKTASYDADTLLESFIVTYFINEWYMYGRLITENYMSKIDPPAAIQVSANLGDVGGKTVGELKEMIYSWWKGVPFGQLGVLVFIGIMSQILWNDDDGIITSSTRYQVTPIGGYSGGDGKFLISSYMNDDIFTFRINNGVFSELKKINLS